jgi:membrane fusion protein, multidrug efflux system
MNEALKPDEVTQRSAPAPREPATVEAPPRRRRSWLTWIVVIAALAAAGVFFWKRYGATAPTSQPQESSGRPAQPPQTVRVAPIILGDMPLTIDALGTVTPFETVTIRTQIAGVLQHVGFTEGQTVKAGDFIAQIDPRPYEAALAQAQGQLAKDQALLSQAQGDLARYQQLAKQDSIAQQQVTDQMALVAQDKAAISADQALVKTAELNVGYTHIVSPITGRVGLRLVDPGNYLQPSDASGIVVITEIDPISVVFTTPEDNLPRIGARLNSGAKLPVTVLDRSNANTLTTGTLTTYDSQIDVTTGTIRMRATFDNPKGVLFPNQFVNVRLLVDTMTGAVLAPNAAIQLGASGNFVYLLNGDIVSKHDVVIGPTDGKHTVITSGLAAGDKVVIDGVDRLRDGAKVKVVDHPASAGAGSQAGSGKGAEQGAAGSAAGSGAGDGQHHKHRHDQSGANESSPPPSDAANPPTATDASTQGQASGAAPSAHAPPAGAPNQTAPAAPSPSAAPSGASGQGAAK